MKTLSPEHGLKRYTPSSIVDESAYLEELVRVREQGYAFDSEEYLSGVNAVAIHLGEYRGLSLAIWVAAFAGSMGPEIIPQIVSEMGGISENLRMSMNMN